MAAQTTARFKQFLSVSRIATLLFGKLAFKAILPEVGRDSLYLLLAVGIAHMWSVIIRVRSKAPEGRHFRAGTKGLGVREPYWNPFLAEFQTHILQVWPNLFLVLHQILRLQVQLIDASCQDAVRYLQCLRLRQHLLR